MGDEKGKKELLDESPRPRQRITNLSAAGTNHKQAEPYQMASDWLEIAERAANAGFYDWDMRTGQLTWSEGFYQLFGLPPTAQPSFETWLTVVHPDDREPAMATINES